MMGSPDQGFPLPPITAPPLLNRPAQLFGNTFDRLPPIHMPADMAAAHMFGSDPNVYMEESNEAKRRRIARVSGVLEGRTEKQKKRTGTFGPLFLDLLSRADFFFSLTGL